jgi:hypothetical protein
MREGLIWSAVERATERGAEVVVWVVFRPYGPGGPFAARRWVVRPTRITPDGAFITGSTLEAVRAQIPPGLVRLEPRADDAPPILEIWTTPP